MRHFLKHSLSIHAIYTYQLGIHVNNKQADNLFQKSFSWRYGATIFMHGKEYINLHIISLFEWEV